MMERRPRPDWIDEGLWVRLAGVDGRCFIRGNAHTHPGRFGVWSDSLDRGLAASKDEIVECSDASRWWVEGFLSGNEPSFGDYYGYQADDRDVHADDLRWDRLRRLTARFRDTGSHGQIAREPPITIPAAVIDGFPRVWHGGDETTWLREPDGGWVLASEDLHAESLKRGRACEGDWICDDWTVEVSPDLWICPECGQLVF